MTCQCDPVIRILRSRILERRARAAKESTVIAAMDRICRHSNIRLQQLQKPRGFAQKRVRAEVIRFLRFTGKWKQQAIADLLNCDRSVVSNVINNKSFKIV
jgi:hypothetical protein